MTNTRKRQLTSKWLLVVQEYELIKQKRSKNFKTVKELCETFRVHRKDILKYYARWLEEDKNIDGLLPRKRGPKPGTTKLLSKEEERIIIKINRRLQANEFEIFNLIKGKFKVDPAVSTIYRTLKRFPLNKKNIKKIKRYEKKYPGELLHADSFHISKTVFQNRQKQYLFGVIDDCTRLCYVVLMPKINAAEATKAYFECHKWFLVHGIIPQVILTDNGSEFTCYTSQKARKEHFFETMLKIHEIKHIRTKPYRPQTNGKIERFWRILKEECINLQTKGLSQEEFIAELNGFLWRYNYKRCHSALKYNTPFDKLKFVTEILK